MLRYKEVSCNGLEELIKKFKDDEFNSPYRSTIPLIYMAVNHPDLLDPLLKERETVFEFEVKPKKGKGYPSCSDLVLLNQNECVVIEAKRTEPKYETVLEWNTGSDNKRLVLEGWLEYINDYTGNKITIKDVENLPYQLIHRVASVCAINKAKSTVVYIVFDPTEEKGKYYKEILKSMKRLTGTKIYFKYGFFDIDKSKQQIKFEEEWDLGNREMKNLIINEIKKEKLMTIKKREMNSI